MSYHNRQREKEIGRELFWFVLACFAFAVIVSGLLEVPH